MVCVRPVRSYLKFRIVTVYSIYVVTDIPTENFAAVVTELIIIWITPIRKLTV